MILQHIIFPHENNCEEEELYFRKDNKSHLEASENLLFFESGGTVSFDTYFNAISIGKWLKYTVVNQIDLCLKIRGKYTLSLVHISESLKRQPITEVVSEINWDTKDAIEEIRVPLDCGRPAGIAGFKLTALEEGSEMYGGAYVTEMVPIDKVKLALIICTFCREHFVYNNINILKKAFFNNETSALRDKIKVYISDNGNSLTVDKNDSIMIFPNKNTGGAGGFTRGMIEAWKEREHSGVTHILLMDDDVIIQPESIYRTYTLWSLLRTKYQDSFIGGAMLSQEEPWLQIEAGAYWNGGDLQSRKSKFDLRNVIDCVRNEREEICDYNAWWYCSFPMSHVRDDNLPLPIFIRGDDVEFGLRNMKHLILLNGICVWHQPFENKYSSTLYYYIYRNRLVINAIHGSAGYEKKIWREICGIVFQELFIFRYKNAKLLLTGIEDFLKGVDWLKQQDGEKINEKVLAESYHLLDVTEIKDSFDLSDCKEGIYSSEGRIRKIIRKLLLNGMFLKGDGNVVVSLINPHAYYFYRKERALCYDYIGNRGFIIERDRGEFLRILKKMLQLKRCFEKNHESIAKEYKSKGEDLLQLEFWERYLRIEREKNE